MPDGSPRNPWRPAPLVPRYTRRERGLDCMRNPAGRLREAIIQSRNDILDNSALEAGGAIFGWRRQLPALARTALLLFLPAALLLSIALVQR